MIARRIAYVSLRLINTISLVLLLSFSSGIVGAQEITIGSTNLLPNTVSMPPARIQEKDVPASTVSLLEYLRGVCRAEIGTIGLSQSGSALTDSQKIELYKAQAMAAATYLAKRANGSSTIFVSNSEAFQTYLRRGDIPANVATEVNNLIDSAVTETNVKNSVFFLGVLAETLYYNATGSGFTKNGNEANNNGYFYNSELRRQITPEKSANGIDRAGMSQIGAKHLAFLGQTGEQILAHYYGAMPPYVKKVRILQDSAEKVLSSWADNLVSAASAPSRTQYFSATPLGPCANTILQIEFSEEVVSPGAGIQVSIDNQTIMGGVRERPRTSQGAVSPGEPVERWNFSISDSQLANIADGEHTLQICAAHRFFQALSLDSNPKTMAFKSFAGNALSQYESGCDSTVKFSIIRDLNAHTVNSAAALYDNFKGVSGSAPSTLELSHTISIANNSAGISSARIDGPHGNLWSHTFDPPVPSTFTSLSDLSVGNYTVQSFNSVGEGTKTPFNISDLDVSVSLLESTQNYIDGDLINSGTFYIKAHIVADSLAELNRIQVLTSTGGFLSTWALLAERIVSGHSASGDFDLPAFPISCPPGLPWSQDHLCVTDPRSYLARAIDSEGNIKAVTFTLTLTNKNGLSSEPPPALLGNGSYDYSYGTDTTKSDYIPAPMVRNYDIVESTSGRYRDTGTAYGIEPFAVSEWIPQHSANAPDTARPQTIGTLQQIIRTWGNDDKSDISETVVSEVEVFFDTFETHEYQDNIYCNNQMGLFLCGRQTINTPVLQSAKRYVEWETVYNKTSDATTTMCRRISYDDYLDFECARFGARIVSFGSVGVKLFGFTLSQTPTPPVHLALIPIGKNIFAPLNSYGEAYFDEVTSPGYLSVTATTSKPPAGFLEAAQNTAYEITPSPELSFTGNVKLVLKYPSGNLTSAQENQMKLVKVIDPATGKYNELVATLDPVKKTITVTITSFSKFMALAPEYPDPQSVQSPNSINGAPEMEFMSGAAASLTQYAMGGAAGAGTLAALKSANKLPVGNVYSLSTDTDTFEPSGAIKMRYSGGVVADLGVDEDSLAIYGFTEDGDLYKLPYLTLDKDNKVLTARVRAAYPLFAVLASSQQVENTPPSVYPDGISPETTISFGGISLPVVDGTYISSATTIQFSASDPQGPDVITSGVNLTNYILNPDSNMVEISTYTGPFTLPEGAYPMYYMSVDNAGNYEFPKATTIYVDATAPETALSILELNLVPSASFYATLSGTITLLANDPLINGVRSGVYDTFYLVDKNLSECQSLTQYLANPSGQLPIFSGQPGTCENPQYTAPFILFPGTHTVQYLSIDNVRNEESPKTVHLEVAGEDTVPPEAFLLINGSTISTGGSAYITPDTQITLGATDPESTGMASGIKAIYYLIDITTASCQAEPDMIGPAGTCRNPLYTGPFTLPTGTHIVYCTAEDNAGNMSVIKSANFSVAATPRAAGFAVPVPMLENRILHAETLLPDGRVLITGGRTGNVPLSSAELYDPVSKTFSITGSMKVPRTYHTSILLPDGKVLIAVGRNSGGFLSSAELYDPATGIFTYTGTAKAVRAEHTATLLPNGKVLFVGGYANGASLSSAELYNPADGTFSTISPMSAARDNHTATLLPNGLVLLAGGTNASGTLSTALLYNPATETFSPAGQLSAPRGLQTAVSLPNGEVLLVGGLGAGYAYLSSAEVYDPVHNTFAATTGQMSMVRNQPVAALLPTGKVLVAGGHNGSIALSSAELYDPVTGTFTAASSMSTGRDNHTATSLRDGKVLIAGGAATPSAEVYDPGFSVPVSIALTSIAVLPSSATIGVGATQQFTATGNFSDGSSRALGASDGLVWSTDNSAVATISTDGLATGVGDGAAHITVSSGIISAEASLVAGVIPPVAGFAVPVPMLENRILHAETLLPDGRVLITGGRTGNVPLSSAELYDPVSKTFSITGSMKVPRTYHTSILLPDGKVLIAVGRNSGGFLSSAELYDPATGIFTYTDSAKAVRAEHTATLLPNGKVLFVGGYANGASLSSAELYNPADGTFSTISPMSAARDNHTATLLPNGLVLLAGGTNASGTLSTALLYNPATETFSPAGQLSAPRGLQTAVSLPNGEVLLVGGLGAGYAYLSSAEVYDPVHNTFAATTGQMSTVRNQPVAALLPTGKVLVAGGHNSSIALSSAELYDPVTGTFTAASPMSTGRDNHTATSLSDGKVLIAGGAATPSAEVYDPGFSVPVSIALTSIAVLPSSATIGVGATQQFTATGNFSDGSSRALGASDGLVWSTDNSAVATISTDGLATGVGDGAAHITVSSGIISAEASLVAGVIPPVAGFAAPVPMLENRILHAETLLPDGRVLITGGRTGNVPLSSAELYDPVSKTFSITGSMNVPRTYHTSILLPDGKVLIAVGRNSGGFLSSAELYDPATGIFTYTDSAKAVRAEHTATLLPNGKVLFAGGYANGASLSSAELYNPADGTFSTISPMSAARDNHTATLLPNGLVLLAGGTNASGTLSTALLYNPATETFSPAGQLSAPRGLQTAVSLLNGEVLLVGGLGAGYAYLSSAEVYDPVHNTFAATTGQMSTVRNQPVAALLPTGKVLVAGGHNGSAMLSSAELYDPATGTFSAAGSMSTGRDNHTATSLRDGKVLIAGGAGTPSAEVYDPVIGSSFTMTVSPETITQVNNYATAEYVLPVPGFVTLEVLSSTAPYSTLRSIHSALFQAAGHQSAQWDGKGVNAAVLGDGAYILRLMVVGVSGNFSASAERTVFIDNYPQIQSIAAKPASFNPPSGERTRFVFSVSEDVILNVAVKDLSGGLIKDLAVNAPSPAGSLNFYWDGRDNSGQLVPPGSYHITVNAVDRTGHQTEASGGNCEVLSPSYPAITGLSETPDPFDARIAGSTVTFSYHLAAVSQTSTVFPVTITISHPLLGIVKTMTLQQEQGDRSVLWDGVSDPGSPLNGLAAPDGAYSEEVSVNVDGQIASAYGAFSLLRNNVYSAQSSGSEPTVTVQYDDPVAQISITQDPPITSTVSAALLSQTLSGNVLASPIFDIVATQAFTTQPVLRFKYDPVFDGESLALYKYSILTGTWIQVSTSYYVDLANNEIIITLNPDVFMGSLFALMKSDDTLPPVTGLVFTGSRYAAGGNQYISGQTMIGLRAQDPGGSGVSYIEYRTDGGAFASYTTPFTLPAGAHVIEYRSADNAGNIEDVKTSNITVDGLAPVSAVSLVGISGRNGWYLSGVDAAISASDAQAGIKETLYRLDGGSFAVYASSFAVLSEGQHALEVYSIDNVSNVEISTTIGFGIDTAAPVSTAVISGTIKNGWYSSAVTLDLASMDGISGVKDIKWSLDGSGYAVYTEPIVVSSEGKHVVSYYAEDMAGNTELSKTIEFSMNSSAPLVDYLLSPLPNLDGWNNGPVNVMFRASDTLSGIEECSSITVTTEGKDQKIAGWCRDLAGNVGYSTATLNIDSTEPGITISSPVAGALFMAGRDKIEIRLVVEDNLDPAPAVMAVVTQIADKGTPRGEGPGSVVVVNGQLIDPLELDDGLWRLEVSARDIAGNSTQAVSGPFEVAHDTMPPQTSLSVGVPNFVSGGSTFITSHTPLLFSAADDMLIAGDRSGVGVAATYIYLDSRLVDVLSSPFFVPGENVHAVDYYSVDRASNTETAHSASFTVDNSSPVSSIAFSGATSAGADGVYSLPKGSSVTFTAADMPAGAASGVSEIWYSVDSGAALVFDSAFTLAVGTHTVIYWSVDNLGNTEAGKTALVSVGESAWMVKLNLEPSTLNLKSKGESVTAKLRFEGSGQACFKPKTLKISAINGLELNNPIFAQSSKAKDDDDSRCGSITVKFDREVLIAFLPPNAVSNITVSGALTDGRGFSASDTIKTIKPKKTTRKDGGRLENERRAGFDAPAGALRQDDDLYVLSVEGDYGPSESRKDASAKARGIARRGSAYEFGPDGAIFDKPVTISLPYDADDRSSEKLAVAYWNEGVGLWELLPSRRDAAAKLIKADVPHFSQYQVVLASYAVSSQETVRRVRASEQGELSVSAADAEFRLGEVYVYPNPAKGGKVPTFHVEVGIADIVKIRVYTVAGQLVHERSLAGTPQTIGSVYAYEYAWAGHIASGVYYYTIEAERTGKKLKSRGKFAVVR